MKKIFILVGVAVLCLGFVACDDDDTATEKRARERARLKEYMAEKGYEIVSTYPSDSIWTNKYYLSPSDLLVHEISAGTDKKVYYGVSTVSIRYVMMNLDGDTLQHNLLSEPFSFTVGEGQAIRGIEEAVTYMTEGGELEAIIPSQLAYDRLGIRSGDGYLLNPYETVIYYIDLLDIGD